MFDSPVETTDFAEFQADDAKTREPEAKPADLDEIKAALAPTDIRMAAPRRALNMTPNEKVAARLLDMFRTAEGHRASIGVTGDMEREARQFSRVHEPDDLDLIEETGVDIYAPLSLTKYIQGHAKLRQVFSDAVEGFPATLEPSPIPELPESKKALLRQQLLEAMLQAGIPVTPQGAEPALPIARQLVSRMRDEVQAEAALSTQAMERKLRARAKDMNLPEVMSDLASNILVYRSGFVLYGRKTVEPKLHYDGDIPVVRQDHTDSVEAVAPFRVYPMPDCKTVQDGTGIFITGQVSEADIAGMSQLPGYQNTSTVLARLRDGTVMPDWLSTAPPPVDGPQNVTAPTITGKPVDTLLYLGKVSSDDLTELGVKPGISGQFEAELLIIAGFVVYARLNAHPLGRRQLAKESYVDTPGQFWGYSMFDLVWPAQRLANATLREIGVHVPAVVNPIVEASIDRWALSARPARYQPGMMLYTYDETAGGGQPAIRVNGMNSHISELIGLYEKAHQDADDKSGLPRYSYGGNANAGAKTYGGLALMLQNQSLFFTTLVKRMGKSIIIPLVYDMYLHEMLYGDDKSVKADAKVTVKALEGLLKREQKEARATEDLQVLGNIAAALPQGGGAVLLPFAIRQYMQARGYSDHEINSLVPDPLQQQALAGAGVLSPAAPGQLGQPSAQGNPPAPQAPPQAPNDTLPGGNF